MNTEYIAVAVIVLVVSVAVALVFGGMARVGGAAEEPVKKRDPLDYDTDFV